MTAEVQVVAYIGVLMGAWVGFEPELLFAVTVGLQIVAYVGMLVDPEDAVLPGLEAGPCICSVEQIAGTEELTVVTCLLRMAASGYVLGADPAEVEQKALLIVTEVGSDLTLKAEDAAELVRIGKLVVDTALPVVEVEPRSEEEPGLVLVEPCYKALSGVVAWYSGASFELEPKVEPVFEADYRMAQ